MWVREASVSSNWHLVVVSIEATQLDRQLGQGAQATGVARRPPLRSGESGESLGRRTSAPRLSVVIDSESADPRLQKAPELSCLTSSSLLLHPLSRRPSIITQSPIGSRSFIPTTKASHAFNMVQLPPKNEHTYPHTYPARILPPHHHCNKTERLYSTRGTPLKRPPPLTGPRNRRLHPRNPDRRRRRDGLRAHRLHPVDCGGLDRRVVGTLRRQTSSIFPP